MPVETHRAEIAVRDPIAKLVDAGSELVITVAVVCPEGCDLRGCRVNVTAGEEVLASAEVVAYDAGVYVSEELAFAAPGEVGEQKLMVVLEERKIGGVIHEDGRMPIPITTRAHATSLAAWGVPSPIVVGHRFEMRVGARCAAGCGLGGGQVQVYDEAGLLAATAELAETAWPGTDALYWAPISLTAPEREGSTSWSVAFVPKQSKLPHDSATSTFGAAVVAAPEHTATISVTDKATGAPIEGVRVLLSAYRGVTDRSGIARVALPTGAFGLLVRKAGYLPSSSSVEVAGDIAIHMELEREPERHPYEDWM